MDDRGRQAATCLAPALAPKVGGEGFIEVEIRDYNGTGRWSREGILTRYGEYCRALRLPPSSNLSPREHPAGEVRWVYPVMHEVIKGIEAGDPACIALGVDFIEEDQHFPFGKILKSNTARALRRSPLSAPQVTRIRNRVTTMLLAGQVPHEFKQYAKLLSHIGVGGLWPEIEQRVPRENRYVMRWYNYLRTRLTAAAIGVLTLLSCATPTKRVDAPAAHAWAVATAQAPASARAPEEPVRGAPPHVTVAKGGRVFPRDFLWTGKEYALVYVRAKSSVDSTVYLARIDPDGRVLSDVRIAEGLTPRLAFSGGGYGIAYDSYRSERWDIYFSKADAAGMPLEQSEVKLGPGSYPLVAWNPASETWGVFWRNFEASGTSTFTLARLPAAGRVEENTRVATLVHPAEGFGDAIGLWPKERGFSCLLAPPPRLRAVDHGGVVQELPLPPVYAALKGRSQGSTPARRPTIASSPACSRRTAASSEPASTSRRCRSSSCSSPGDPGSSPCCTRRATTTARQKLRLAFLP